MLVEPAQDADVGQTTRAATTQRKPDAWTGYLRRNGDCASGEGIERNEDCANRDTAAKSVATRACHMTTVAMVGLTSLCASGIADVAAYAT